MQQELDELREQLDVINSELVALLEQRFEITDEVGALKAANNIPVRDRKREEAILEKIGLALHDKDKYADVAEIFELIFECARAREGRGR